MKYEPVTTLILLLLFTITQFIGLLITQQYYTEELPYSLEPPPVRGGWSVSYLVLGIIVVTIIFYLFNKLKFEKFLKVWFGVAVLMSLSVALSTFLGDLMGFITALVFTTLRLFTKDQYIHNLTELLIYGGIVSIFAPLFSPLSVIILLIIVSVYDFISVFVTKHMVAMARSQSAVNLFSGLMVKHKGETAILGGGDIAFSLLFATVIGRAFGVVYAYLNTYLVITSLIILTLIGRKGKFYPAMPFITGACLVSYLVALI
ncbi:hypothetical protein GF352_03395 [archaeon]|nr:hypothetical protein [archaeon]